MDVFNYQVCPKIINYDPPDSWESHMRRSLLAERLGLDEPVVTTFYEEALDLEYARRFAGCLILSQQTAPKFLYSSFEK
jgi:hypothetical protein